MKQAVIFDQFARVCDYFEPNTDVNNGYGCSHPNQEETEEIDGKEQGMCFCFCCPLGIPAEQCDKDKNDPDAVPDEIDWDGLCDDGIVYEDEYLLVDSSQDAPEDVQKALKDYNEYLNRYSAKID